jgi:hypothetical protein
MNYAHEKYKNFARLKVYEGAKDIKNWDASGRLFHDSVVNQLAKMIEDDNYQLSSSSTNFVRLAREYFMDAAINRVCEA